MLKIFIVIGRDLKFVALLACFIWIAGILSFFYVFPDRLDPQGRSNRSCFSEALPQVPNGTGLLVSAHQTYCDDVVHDSAIYVYLRKSGEAESRDSLIFRFADDPVAARPKMEWVDDHTLDISVDDVLQVTKIVHSLGDVNINYSIGAEKIPDKSLGGNLTSINIVYLILSIFIIFIIYASLSS